MGPYLSYFSLKGSKKSLNSLNQKSNFVTFALKDHWAVIQRRSEVGKNECKGKSGSFNAL